MTATLKAAAERIAALNVQGPAPALGLFDDAKRAVRAEWDARRAEAEKIAYDALRDFAAASGLPWSGAPIKGEGYNNRSIEVLFDMIEAAEDGVGVGRAVWAQTPFGHVAYVGDNEAMGD